LLCVGTANGEYGTANRYEQSADGCWQHVTFATKRDFAGALRTALTMGSSRELSACSAGELTRSEGGNSKTASRSRRAATLPYEATRTTTRQPSCSGAMPCYARVRGGCGGGDPWMACKGSGVQIPSAPPQVRGPIRAQPPPYPRPWAADWQQTMNETCPHCLREVRFDVQAVYSNTSGESHQIQQCQACHSIVYRLAITSAGKWCDGVVSFRHGR
jgi:hypothetical protein